MQKQAPTLGRLLVMSGFALSCFGLLLYLWLAFGGPVPLAPKGYRFETSFGEATSLAKEADVRISGVPVGRVAELEVSDDGRSRAVIEIDSRFAPIPRDARAILRQKTLLGETYVELTPGHRRAGNMLEEGGRLAIAQVSPTVEVDEVARTFDPETRAAYRTWVQSLAVGSRGRGSDLSGAVANLEPFAEDSTKLLQLLESQDADLRGIISNSAKVFDALSTRDGQLTSLIRSSNRVFATTGERNEDLRGLFRALPTFQRESRTTVERLDRFARNADPLTTQLRPAARELSPTLQEVSGLAPDLQALFRGLDPVIDASEDGVPATNRVLDRIRDLLGELTPTLRQLTPLLRYTGRYTDEFRSAVANPVGATQASVDGKHYLRVASPLLIENMAAYPRRIGSNRNNAYSVPGATGLRAANTEPSFETRQCGRGVPAYAPTPPGTPSGIARFLADIGRFTTNPTGGPVGAPPCIDQPGGYPQVAADPDPAAAATAARRRP